MRDTMIHDIETYPPEKILDVTYRHLTFDDGDEMYITDQGLAVWQNLLPENFWKDKAWFLAHSEKQQGSGCVYKIRTKPAAGKHLDIIMKWNRMGRIFPEKPTNRAILCMPGFSALSKNFSFLRHGNGQKQNVGCWSRRSESQRDTYSACNGQHTGDCDR